MSDDDDDVHSGKDYNDDINDDNDRVLLSFFFIAIVYRYFDISHTLKTEEFMNPR